jgi:hypothetical protein
LVLLVSIFFFFDVLPFTFVPTYFTAGQYAILVPFFNANFDGKVARFHSLTKLDDDLQELDLTVDRFRPRVYKGYRGGFVSLWNGQKQ